MEAEGKYRIVEVQKRLLCFEYVPNGNLHHYIKGMKFATKLLPSCTKCKNLTMVSAIHAPDVVKF